MMTNKRHDVNRNKFKTPTGDKTIYMWVLLHQNFV